MKWYWTVRIYNDLGQYAHAYAETGESLREIDTICDNYLALTKCKMLLEGMSRTKPESLGDLNYAFCVLWSSQRG